MAAAQFLKKWQHFQLNLAEVLLIILDLKDINNYGKSSCCVCEHRFRKLAAQVNAFRNDK